MKVGVLTVGQSPRPDILSEFEGILDGVEIVEKGCLDGLTKPQIKKMKQKGKEPFLVTLLRDGTSVEISKEKTTTLLKQRIKELENEVDAIFLACTEDFPNLESRTILLEASKLVHGVVENIVTGKKKLGLLIPTAGQVAQVHEKWRQVNHVIAVAFPFEKTEEVEAAARKLKLEDVDLVVLDCMAYDKQSKKKMAKLTGKPVILPRTLAATVLKELY